MLPTDETKRVERKLTSAERFFSRSPYSIVTMVARIKGTVTDVMLKEAVVKLQQRHALLRVRIIDEADHSQWFSSNGVGEIPVIIVPRRSANDWINIHTETSRIPFEFEDRPAIRFILVQAKDASELIIHCHHTICDGLSLAYLARDLMDLLGNPAKNVELLPAPPVIELNNLPDEVSQSGLVVKIIDRMNQKWAEESEYFDQEDYEILTETYWANFSHEVISIEMPAEDTSELVSRCKKEGVSVNSALTAAFTGAQSFVEGKKPYHDNFAIATSLRGGLPNPVGEGMGMYAGAIELKYKYNHKKSFWENARKLHQKIQPNLTNKVLFRQILTWLYLDPTIFEAMNFKKLGRLVSPDASRYEKLSSFSQKEDVVLKLLQRDKIDSLEAKKWGAAVTNLGRLDFHNRYGDLVLDRLIMQPGGGIPLVNVNLVIGAVTCSDKLSLVVEYAPEAIDQLTIREITDKALDFLLAS